ncbi:UNVERIFIED_CONTAM: hypothetical protein Slati_4299100 [Sesamum latifolium]|uniref:Uncharacterized protein n=1 Tax=Sesamum latifolium TaxID=2727402 RepID=A0AAW2TDI7_9LAMI
MTEISGFDSTRFVIGLKESWQSCAYEGCILDMASCSCVVRHGHYMPYPVQSEYVAKTVESKKEFVPSQYCDNEISYAL